MESSIETYQFEEASYPYHLRQYIILFIRVAYLLFFLAQLVVKPVFSHAGTVGLQHFT